MNMEWDEKKRLLTLAKHEIDFADAIEIFFADHLVLPGRSEIEERKRAIAPLVGKMICVIFTQREGAIGIIPARVARKNEREQYQAIFARRDSGDERSN